jgi:hypothetical protein
MVSAHRFDLFTKRDLDETQLLVITTDEYDAKMHATIIDKLQPLFPRPVAAVVLVGHVTLKMANYLDMAAAGWERKDVDMEARVLKLEPNPETPKQVEIKLAVNPPVEGTRKPAPRAGQSAIRASSPAPAAPASVGKP